MSEFASPIAIAGIRPELYVKLSPKERTDLLNATLRTLQAKHHPDAGGQQKYSHRVNEAASDLKDELMLPDIRDEYLANLRFSDVIEVARNSVEAKTSSAQEMSLKAAEIVSCGNSRHFIEVAPCEITLIDADTLVDAIDQASEDIDAKEEARAMEKSARIESEISKKLTVSEEEVQAQLADFKVVFELAADHLRVESLEWTETQLRRRYPELAKGQRSIDDKMHIGRPDATENDDSYSEVMAELFLEFLDLQSTKEALGKIIRKQLEEDKRSSLILESSEDDEDVGLDDAFPQEPLVAQATSTLENIRDQLDSFSQALLDLRRSSNTVLRIGKNGKLLHYRVNGEERPLDGITLVAALRTYAPISGFPPPWSVSRSDAAALGEGNADLGRLDAPRSSLLLNLGSEGRLAVSDDVLEWGIREQMAHLDSTNMTTSFREFQKWVAQDQSDAAEGKLSKITTLIVQRERSGKSRLEILGQVVSINTGANTGEEEAPQLP